MWEEPIISGTQGSGTIFFSGCNMACVFCQNYEISHRVFGKRYSIDSLIDAIFKLQEMGAHNINFVNPSHYVHILVEVLSKYRPKIPVVYNTSGYDSVESLRRLQGLVDIYLPDCKYIDEQTALRYSGRVDYPNVAKQAIDEMVRQQPQLTIQNGLMQKGVLIRHLVLPNQTKQSVALLQYLYNTYGERVYYSVMSQYTPYGDAANYPEIDRKLKPLEYKAVVSALIQMGATNVFLQDETSADSLYIPPFEGE